MEALINFAFEDNLVRVITRDGEPWFVASDVCRCLDLVGIPGQHTKNLDEDEKGMGTIHTLGGPQEVIIISEPGLYRLVFRSRKPEAERFKRWIAHDVLPAIRKSGRYEAAPATAAPTLELDENLNARIQAVRLASQLWGKPAARALWRELGISVVPEMTPAPLASFNDPRIEEEARDCLEHLMESRIDGNTYRDLIWLATDDNDKRATEKLKSNGIRIERDMFEDGPGILVARSSRCLTPAFAGTRWAGFGWGSVLLQLPGARRSKKAAERYGGGPASKSVFIPLPLLALEGWR